MNRRVCLAVTSNEKLLLLFTSGRVETYSVNNIPTVELGGTWSWEQAAMPNEPHAGEQLACVVPFSHLPLSDFFLQVSRRGCIKKTMTSMAQSILDNHFIGRGAMQKSDQPFDLTLCAQEGPRRARHLRRKSDRLRCGEIILYRRGAHSTHRNRLCHRVFHHPSRISRCFA